MKHSKKTLILGGISLAVLIFGFLGLLFNIVSLSVFGQKASVNGFSVIFEYPAAIEDIGAWLGLYSIAYIIVWIVFLGIVSYSFVKKETKSFLKMCLINNIVICGLTLGYMFNGILAVLTAKESVEGMYSGLVDANTLAFLPFIIIASLLVAYFVVKRYLSEDFSMGRVNNPTNKEAVIGRADELKKYKELFDAGVISQEEFEEKKKQLL